MSLDDRRPFALAVDDDVLILMDVCDMLAEAGFRPLEAVSVEDAERVLIEYADEVVLLFTDVHMPGERDGFDLAKLTAERWPSVGIMVCSGLANPDDERLPEGAVFLRKPFSAEAVYQRIQELLPDGRKPEPLKNKVRPH